MDAISAKSRGTSLSLVDQQRLRALVEKFGQYRAAELIGIGYSAIARALAGLGIRHGTIIAIQVRLKALEDTE